MNTLFFKHRHYFSLTAAVLIISASLVGTPNTEAATIVVTTTDPGVHGDSTCSLEEAIFSANYGDNVAPDPNDTTQFVVTGCNKGGSGNTIVLQTGATYTMSNVSADPYNPLGPTATPLIFSNLTIEGNGAKIVRGAGAPSMRAFAVGDATVDLSAIDPGRTVSGTGELTLNNGYIVGFSVKGGDGETGGGGGMGAGGAIYLKGGELTVVNSTFDSNVASGGAGSYGSGGGGGGLSGHGGAQVQGNGGGGGGSVGNGADGFTGGGGPIDSGSNSNLGGGGGGTLTSGNKNSGGTRCGGGGGGESGNQGGNGNDAGCPGGGGGGGSIAYSDGCEPGLNCPSGGHGGSAGYGGGGGGGGNGAGIATGDDGGNGGFGGGGGGDGGPGYFTNTKGGDGGFGGGGGCGYADNSNDPGHGGIFGGNANPHYGGGGAGLGGAIFNDNGTLSVYNCTFVGNTTFAGLSAGASDGEAHGNAVFSHNGTCILTHVTISNNGDSNNALAGDLVIEADNNTGTLHLSNSIVGNNNAGGVNGVAYSFSGGSVSQNNSGNLIQNAGFTSGNTVAIAGNAISADPQVGPLQLNPPGNTPTMAIDQNSPAYEKADPARTLPTDQRGVPRKSSPDIGAFELNEFPQAGPSFIVNTTADHDDGVCGLLDCTLREAINAANAQNGANMITFADNVIGTISFINGLGPLTVTDSVTILGPGARVLVVSAATQDRVFVFSNGTSTVSGLTIRDGFQVASLGSGDSESGAGIYNQANLTVNGCSFANNEAFGAISSTLGANGGDGLGGAIYNKAALTVNDCTFSTNQVGSGAGANYVTNSNLITHGGTGGGALGAAIFNDTAGTLTITNSTFSGNIASAGKGGDGSFGGHGGSANAAVFSQGSMTMIAASVSGNNASAGAGGSGSNKFNSGAAGTATGGLSSAGGTNTVQNTISAGNTGQIGSGTASEHDVNGAFSSGGYNFIGVGDNGTGFTAAGDQVGTTGAPIDPKLGPLQDNSGPTDTMALLANSLAIDQGNGFGLSTDQRGFLRVDLTTVANAPGGDGTDIGAFEFNGTVPTPTPTPTPIPTPTPTPTPSLTPTTLGNISTRMLVETGDNVLIGGFIVTGTADKKVIVRGRGPSLTDQGVSGALQDPILELHDANGIIATNDNWKDTQQTEIEATGLPPTNDLESAIVATLPANTSLYTAILRGVNDGTGVGLVEVYDLDRTVDSKLANISTRGLVQTGDNAMIGGVILLGQGPLNVIVRAIGPSLASKGVANALADPTLELYDGNGTLLAFNDNWKDTQQAEIEATGVPPTNDLESAIVATLNPYPATYTAIVRGVNNTTGVALVEVYALN
jgi:CSLREA domain-containing protein